MRLYLFAHSHFGFGFNYTAIIAENEAGARATLSMSCAIQAPGDVELIDESEITANGAIVNGRYDE